MNPYASPYTHPNAVAMATPPTSPCAAVSEPRSDRRNTAVSVNMSRGSSSTHVDEAGEQPCVLLAGHRVAGKLQRHDAEHHDHADGDPGPQGACDRRRCDGCHGLGGNLQGRRGGTSLGCRSTLVRLRERHARRCSHATFSVQRRGTVRASAGRKSGRARHRNRTAGHLPRRPSGRARHPWEIEESMRTTAFHRVPGLSDRGARGAWSGVRASPRLRPPSGPRRPRPRCRPPTRPPSAWSRSPRPSERPSRPSPRCASRARRPNLAEGQADQARSPLLPQVTGTAAYTRETGNFALRPGVIAPGARRLPLLDVVRPAGASA